MTKQILFITSTRIGDAVLSTGILRHIEDTYSDAEVTIVCGPLCTSLFEGYPLKKEIIALKKEKHNKHWLKLWQRAVKTKWDIVIDLRNSAVSRLIFAKERYIAASQINKKAHKVEQAAQVLRLEGTPPAPKLWFTSYQMKKASEIIGEDTRPILAIGPTANWIGKTWPRDYFLDLLDAIALSKGSKLETHRIAILAAPGEEKDAEYILSKLPEDRRIDVIAKTTPGEAAAFLSQCEYYIGNDSGLMHCAAACGIKTFGLFGPSWPHLYHPWGENCTHIATEKNFDELIDFEGYDPKTLDHSLMVDLKPEFVINRFLS